MLEWLRDPIWQFVGAALALVGVVVAVMLFMAQRSRKVLLYEVLTHTPLATVNEEAKGQIEIRLKGIPVANVYLMVMRVWNEGNVPILPGDFVEPLGFQLADGTEILMAEVIKSEPDTLKPELQPNGVTLGIAPLLLNKQDAFTVKLLVAGGRETPVVNASGRIAGVKAVLRAERPRYRYSDTTWLYMTGVPAGVSILVAFVMSTIWNIDFWLMFVLSAVVTGMALMWLFRDRFRPG